MRYCISVVWKKTEIPNSRIVGKNLPIFCQISELNQFTEELTRAAVNAWKGIAWGKAGGESGVPLFRGTELLFQLTALADL